MSDMIDWMVSNAKNRPSLSDMAERSGYDTTYFQKLFTQHTGVSPKKFIDFVQYKHAREYLLQQATTLDAAYQSGLSSPSRLHDLFIRIEGVTPGQVSSRGSDLTIQYGWHATPIGSIIIGMTDKGLCWLGFAIGSDRHTAYDRMQRHWPMARFEENQQSTKDVADIIIQIWSGNGDPEKPLPLDLYGTNLQLQIWHALLKIPAGYSVCYKDLAVAIDKPSASRAVGNAVGANPISLIIPCHRVIQSSGIVNNYAWGSERKKALLGLECNGSSVA